MKKILSILALLSIVQIVYAQVNIQVNDDGSLYTAIEVNGSSALKYDIVFLGDGFTATQQARFNRAVRDAVNAMRARAPFSNSMKSFNIYRVNVISQDSGIDKPNQNIFRNTALDARFGDTSEGEATRCVTTDSSFKSYAAASNAPAYDAVFVLVNETGGGGCAGGLVFSTIRAGFANTITHELGHKVFSLGDEYDCYVCGGVDTGERYDSIEHWKANITKITDRATTKWADLIDAATPLPTTVDNPVGVVGLWEGAGYYKYGLYRSQKTCHMKSSGDEFCAVCARVGQDKLNDHLTFCERNPNAWICTPIRLRDFIRLYTLEDYLRVMPLPLPPVCLSCPPFEWKEQYEYRIELKGLQAKAFSITVVDENNKEIAQAKANEKGIPIIEFERKADKNYSLQIKLLDKELIGKEFEIKPEIFENGKQIKLY